MGRKRSTGPGGLADGELHVASLVALGLTDKEIAAQRSTSPITVKTQLKTVFDKLGLTNRVEVARWYIYNVEAKLWQTHGKATTSSRHDDSTLLSLNSLKH